jgi:hypothetical protein
MERSMTNGNPNPAPDQVPDLEYGSVQPGDTPPDAGQTSGLSHPQPMPGRTGAVIALIAVVLLTVSIVAFLVARLVDLI